MTRTTHDKTEAGKTRKEKFTYQCDSSKIGNDRERGITRKKRSCRVGEKLEEVQRDILIVRISNLSKDQMRNEDNMRDDCEIPERRGQWKIESDRQIQGV